MLETHVAVTCREVEHDRASLDVDLQGKLDRVEGAGGSSLCAARKKKARSCSPHAPSVPLVGIYEPGDSEDRRPIHVQILSNGCPPRN